MASWACPSRTALTNAPINANPHPPPPGQEWGFERLLTIQPRPRGRAFVYSKYSLCIHLLHAPYILMAMWGCSSFRIVRVCGALAKIFAPWEVSFAPPLWQIPTLPREGGSGDLQ